LTQFSDLGLSAPLLQALASIGHTTPTPIQMGSIPDLLTGRDLIGIAQTGTGKTAAFGLPMLQRLTASAKAKQPGKPRALILAPTRELVTQIAESLTQLGRHLPGFRVSTAFGGVGHRPQIDALRRGVDVMIACPGRLLDLIEQRACDLSAVEILVLDEADRMLDMGFIQPIKKIVAMVPRQRQTLLFSATMPGEIASLSKAYLNDPKRVEVTPQATTVELIDQQVIFVDHARKPALLAVLLANPAMTRTIVFTRTKHGANRVAERLDRQNISSAAIHGNKSQGARERALADFREGSVRVLVATDLAARGIDVAGITHVVNFDLPHEPESYVHRIGRTARAGASGAAIAFCAGDERSMLKAIERMTRQPVQIVPMPLLPTPTAADLAPIPRHVDERSSRSRSPGRNGSGGKGRSQGGGNGRGASAPPAHGAKPPQRGGQRRPSLGGSGGGNIGEVGFLRSAAPRSQDH